MAVPEQEPMHCDVAIVGAGAAGLATAIFVRRLNPGASVHLFDSAKAPGAKILVSGGSRCNVTNVSVSDADFWGGPRSIVRRVLRAFPVPDTVAFFRGIGVHLHEEADGKLFPDTNRARDVLAALLAELSKVGAVLHAADRVHAIERADDGPFLLSRTAGEVQANRVVLATGGQSLPKTGSDGFGFDMARRLGHTIVPTTPGLVPLLLANGAGEDLHRELTGVAQPVELLVWIENRVAVRLQGPLLWTHFGVSGPVALNASRHWLRAQLERRACRISVSFCPGESFDGVDARLTDMAASRPKVSVQNALATIVPAAVASALARRLGIEPPTDLAHFPRDDRRRLVHALTGWPLAVAGSRGYDYAEVTAGGVPLTEINPATLESRVCPGLFLVGEILDIDGRIGGFNFQWAWSSAQVAARALARRTGR
jgi:predicted Rossmann fold flavoprotein